MKAAILVKSKSPLIVSELKRPTNLEFGQVLVKIFYSGICGAQLNEIDAAKGKDKFLPHLLGHEGSGKILDVGPGVKTVKKNDHVVLHWRQSDGIQSPTPSYKMGDKKINAGWVTTFNDEAIISENRLTVIPKDFDLRIAPLFGCVVTTAIGIINNDAQVKVGQSVLIFGMGGVGSSISQACSMVSAYPVIGVDLHKFKLDLAKNLGMDYGFLHKDKNLEEKIKKIVGNKGADIVIDTTGNSKVIEQAYKLTHPDGKTILCGVPKANDKARIYTLPLHFKKILKGSHGGESKPDLDIPRYIRLIKAGKLSLDKLITHEFTLEDINKAVKTLRDGKSSRIIVRM